MESRPDDEVDESSSAVSLDADGDGNNDEEDQWERTLATGESIVGGEDNFSPDTVAVAAESLPEDRGPLPDLEELLKQVPASSQKLVDALFRGRFTGVQVIDRNKLF